MADRCANRRCAQQLDGAADEGVLSLTLINGLELELELCPACVPLASAGLPLGGYGFSLALRPQQWGADDPRAEQEPEPRVLAAGGGQLVQDPRPSGFSPDRAFDEHIENGANAFSVGGPTNAQPGVLIGYVPERRLTSKEAANLVAYLTIAAGLIDRDIGPILRAQKYSPFEEPSQ